MPERILPSSLPPRLLFIEEEKSLVLPIKRGLEEEGYLVDLI